MFCIAEHRGPGPGLQDQRTFPIYVVLYGLNSKRPAMFRILDYSLIYTIVIRIADLFVIAATQIQSYLIFYKEDCLISLLQKLVSKEIQFQSNSGQ